MTLTMKNHEIVDLLEAIGFEFTLETYINNGGIAVAVVEAEWNGHTAQSDESFMAEFPDCSEMSLEAASRLLENLVLEKLSSFDIDNK